MAQLSAWMGAGVVAAGVSAAMIAGADTASADTGSDTAGAATSASDTADRGTRAADGAAGENDSADASSQTEDADADEDDVAADEADDADPTEDADEADEAPDLSEGNADSDASRPDTDSGPAREHDLDAATDSTPGDGQPVDDEATELTEQSDPADEPPSVGPQTEQPVSAVEQNPPAESPVQPASAVSNLAAQRVSAMFDAPTALAAPQPRTLQDVIQSLFTEIIGAAIRFVAGPPVVPLGVNVTVRSSLLEITEGRYVRAHWYYPDDVKAPEQLIYLQHGFRGVGAMYSYTASWLAERTNSIVVVPTLSSNPYVRDGFWLGDDQVHRATADLLLGDRAALTASAVSAGFARRYGADDALPERFALVGHSLGAGVAAGAAGYYADAVIASGAVNRLAGIVTLDGAPPGSVLSDALGKLDGLGGYIPVLELGAPREDGSPRRVDAALNEYRPGHFNGVVLHQGQHLDSMQGGTWLIQLISYLNQGFPTEQNKSAAQTLIAGWINDIFAGRIDSSTGACQGVSCAGIYGDPGQAVSVATPKGPATGVGIGTPVAPATTEFRPLSVSSLVSARFTSLRLAIAV